MRDDPGRRSILLLPRLLAKASRRATQREAGSYGGRDGRAVPGGMAVHVERVFFETRGFSKGVALLLYHGFKYVV